MADKSAIEWTDATWPIVQGCDPLSQGCVHCYAVLLLWRLSHNPDPKISGPLQGLVEKHVNAAGEEILRFTGKLALREDRLDWPLKWKRPRMIFVPSHGDIFHKGVPDKFLDKIFDAMERAYWHTYQVLTKRSKRQREYVNRRYTDRHAPEHIWFGVSCEDQPNADERIPDILQTRAAIRFVSAEPLLGAINFRGIRVADSPIRIDALHAHLSARLNWIIDGGESGSKARRTPRARFLSIRDQCERAGVAYFHKQNGEWIDADEWLDMIERGPSRLMVGGRQWKPQRPLNYEDAATLARFTGNRQYEHQSDGTTLIRVGKKAAGRLLDGREHNEFPVIDSSASQSGLSAVESKQMQDASA